MSRNTRAARLLAAPFLLAAAATAQISPSFLKAFTQQQDESKADEAPADPLGRSTPRGAAYRFLKAVEEERLDKATLYLDLPKGMMQHGAELSGQLAEVLDRRLQSDLTRLSDDPKGRIDDDLPENRERLGRITTAKGGVDITLVRVEDASGPVWLFSRQTVALIPDLFDDLGFHLDEHMPDILRQNRFFDIPLWQWLLLLALIPACYAVAGLLTYPFAWLTALIVRWRRPKASLAFVEDIRRPVRLFLAALLFRASLTWLGFSLISRTSLNRVVKVVLLAAFLAALFRLADFAFGRLQTSLLAHGQTLANSVVPLMRRVTKVMLAVFGILTLFAMFDYNASALLTGLGIGGIAIAFAAQKTLENLFGGISIIFDRPVVVGDFCRFGTEVGTVEDVGLRSTRIRTLARSLVTIPNASFSSMQVENLAARDKFQFRHKIGLKYSTPPEAIERILADIEALLRGFDFSDKTMMRVRLTAFGASSLDIDVFTYFFFTDWEEFLRYQEKALLEIMQIVGRHGSGLAFPTQTLILSSEARLLGSVATDIATPGGSARPDRRTG